MAPVAQSDIERESHTSDMASQDSPLRRQFSEPIHARSASTQASPSPSPMAQKSKCAWCGEYFESSGQDSTSQKEALKEHIATVHPHIAKFSTYDGAADGDDSVDLHDHGNHLADVDADDSAPASEDEINHAAPEGEDETGEVIEDSVVERADTTEIDDDRDDNGLDREEPDLEGEGEGPEADSELALSNQLHEFSREQDAVSLDKRLHNLWNIHDVRNFTEDFEELSSGLDRTWAAVFHDTKRSKKRDAADFADRPGPYKLTKSVRGEFLEITALEDFLSQLRDPESRSSDELYAITENVAYALKAWQDEYMAIEKLHKLATRHNAKPTTNPRKLDRPAVFEDKKEATLYGYKHDPKEDKVGFQNPFTQGGFKPTGAQARRMAIKAGSDPNPDGWPAIIKFGTRHIPKFQNPPREEFVGKATRKRKAAELEAASKANETDETQVESPAPAEQEEPPIKRRTRSRRSDIMAEPQTTAPPRSSGRGRGRGRGRGGARVSTRAISEAPQPAAQPAVRSSGRTQGREPTTPTTTQTRPPAHLAPIEPAPSGGAPTTTAPSSTTPSGAGPNEALDPAEIARREKIANSKNPKRTEAMLNHWARFNREGRTRNPKRSKAQIEADRAAEAARKATEPPRMGKKKKTPNLVFGKGPTRIDTGLAPAPHMPPPASLAPAPPGPHHQLAPMPPHRPSLPPYAPVDPRSMAPFPGPPGPPSHLQPPPQPYHTPYPYMSPYGAPPPPPPQLPPPSHTRPA
ncbi:hypothetical protein BDV59DRAFT_58355 [Aspergillus ambiguus]|uniref:uncharacterized protein n=1 Tax=Aspergillus ambiguus TaxID=176160 RepID=UPI003CCDD035